MNNQIRLMVSRMLRRDPYVPVKCHAHKFKVPYRDKCDCKIWCKYHPPGNFPASVLENVYLEYRPNTT